MGIKAIAASLVLKRASSRLETRPLSLPFTLKGKSILVLLPNSHVDLTVFKQMLPRITALFGENNVYLLTCPDIEVQSILPSKGLRIITPSKSSVNWFRLPTQSFLAKLKKWDFDFVFDANLQENKFAARVLLTFPNAVRFGCNGRLGHPYLNLEIKTRYLRDRRLIYRSLLEVLRDIAHSQGVTTA
jgi:hypothetical protein